jgi:hypothetical protein
VLHWRTARDSAAAAARRCLLEEQSPSRRSGDPDPFGRHGEGGFGSGRERAVADCRRAEAGGVVAKRSGGGCVGIEELGVWVCREGNRCGFSVISQRGVV